MTLPRWSRGLVTLYRSKTAAKAGMPRALTYLQCLTETSIQEREVDIITHLREQHVWLAAALGLLLKLAMYLCGSLTLSCLKKNIDQIREDPAGSDYTFTWAWSRHHFLG